jgi:hypothetical protein
MLAILDEAGRKFNADKLDGISRRDSIGSAPLVAPM